MLVMDGFTQDEFLHRTNLWLERWQGQSCVWWVTQRQSGFPSLAAAHLYKQDCPRWIPQVERRRQGDISWICPYVLLNIEVNELSQQAHGTGEQRRDQIVSSRALAATAVSVLISFLPPTRPKCLEDIAISAWEPVSVIFVVVNSKVVLRAGVPSATPDCWSFQPV